MLEEQKYGTIYVGINYHVSGWKLGYQDPITKEWKTIYEFKLGKTTSSFYEREKQLTATKSPIKFQVIAAWEVPLLELNKTEKSIHALLDINPKTEYGEYFSGDETSVGRIRKFMNIQGYEELNVEDDCNTEIERKLRKDNGGKEWNIICDGYTFPGVKQYERYANYLSHAITNVFGGNPELMEVWFRTNKGNGAISSSFTTKLTNDPNNINCKSDGTKYNCKGEGGTEHKAIPVPDYPGWFFSENPNSRGWTPWINKLNEYCELNSISIRYNTIFI
jgi:hypothetical protein